MTTPIVLDTTLRDGAHAMTQRFTPEHVRRVAAALDRAGVPIVEVSHGDGLGGSSFQCGFSLAPELELIDAAAEVLERARLAVMILPGIGTAADVRQAATLGARVVRVATLCTEPDLAERYLALARELELEPIAFLMMAHLRPPELLAEQAVRLRAFGAEAIYLADSAGTMLPEDVAARVSAVKAAQDAPVGFHAHDNFGLAMGNCLAALDAGAELLDGSLRGLGAGAGNAPTELLAAVLERCGANPGLDAHALADAAEFVVAPFMPLQPFRDRDAIALASVGMYSTFLQHAREAAERYGVDSREIVLELGRRQALVGQEDWAGEIAAEIAAAQESNVEQAVRA